MGGFEKPAQRRQSVIDRILQPYRTVLGRFHYKQGRKAEDSGNWIDAKHAFHSAVQHDPSVPIYHYRLARNHERLDELDRAVCCYQTAIALDAGRAHWHARLAGVLALQKHYAAAELSYRTALTLNDRPAEWHAALADVLEQQGRDLAASVAWREALERRSRVPEYHFRLGRCLERVADRSGFVAVLDPQNLADLSDTGPSWIGELGQSGPISGRALWQEAERAYRRALKGRGDKSIVWFRLGQLSEKQDNWKRAAECYGRALHKSPDNVNWLYRYQYCSSLASVSASSTFMVTASPHELRNDPPGWHTAVPAQGTVVGYWYNIPTLAYFKIHGYVFRDASKVHLLVDDRPVKSINLEDKSADGQIHKTFRFLLKKALLQSFPSPARLSVATDDACLVHFSGAKNLIVEVTEAKGTLFSQLDAGSYISKKGSLVSPKRSPASLQQLLLAAYSVLRDEFERRFDRPLFLLFGTLLGKIRDGGLLPGDDDFDVGYVTHADTPEVVKQEALGFIKELAQAGYNLRSNPSGRLFKAQVNGLWIDIFPVWQSKGRIWIHNSTSYEGTLDDFLPLRTDQLGGTAVWVPRNPEAFLEGNYGTGWRVPDPGFRYIAPRSVKRYLRRAHITEAELKELQEELELCRQNDPTVGSFLGPKKWRLIEQYRDELAALNGAASTAGSATSKAVSRSKRRQPKQAVLASRPIASA